MVASDQGGDGPAVGEEDEELGRLRLGDLEEPGPRVVELAHRLRGLGGVELQEGAERRGGELRRGGVERRMKSLINLTGPIALGAGIGVIGAGLLRGRKLEDLVGTGVSLAVASVPEGLPLLATAAQLAHVVVHLELDVGDADVGLTATAAALVVGREHLAQVLGLKRLAVLGDLTRGAQSDLLQA